MHAKYLLNLSLTVDLKQEPDVRSVIRFCARDRPSLRGFDPIILFAEQKLKSDPSWGDVVIPGRGRDLGQDLRGRARIILHKATWMGLEAEDRRAAIGYLLAVVVKTGKHHGLDRANASFRRRKHGIENPVPEPN